MKYLVDSDQIIWYLKGKPAVVRKLQTLQRELAVSVISVGEVAEGIVGEKDEEKKLGGLKNFLEGIEVLEINQEIAFQFAKVRASLRKKGRLIDNFDLLIAATCLTHNLILITENKKDFARIGGLRIE
ncbi:MAG: type II toxin-antitoxin system VapC family toxin [Patescibacteria group bacterium]